MKTKLFPLLMLMLLLGFSGYAQSLSGKEIFNRNCQACHSVGKGDVVGPDLAGVTQRRDADWIKSFILNSQKLVSEGNEQAVEVFTKYNKIAMPPHNFNDEELTSLISYLDEATNEATAANEQEAAAPVVAPDQQEVALAESNSGSNLYINLILGFLGVSMAALTAIAIYLYKFLKSY